MDTEGEVAGLPKTEYHKTDETSSTPGKSSHTVTLLLLAVTNYSLQAVEKSFSSNSQSLD